VNSTFSVNTVLYKAPSRLVFLWVLASAVPIIPFTLPLFEQSLSNSPQAYLVWIPVLGFAWAGWQMLRLPFPRIHSFWEFGLGLGVCLISAFFFIFGVKLWPIFFAQQDDSLLLWPVWSIGLFWMLFGVRATRIIIKAMAYLTLIWPTFYLTFIAWLNPLLADITIRSVSVYGHYFSWVRQDAAMGLFGVKTSSSWVYVNISSACSGSDSVLAMLVLFPIMLVFLGVGVVREVALVCAGIVAAILFNIFRIDAIIWSLHQFGPWFAFDIMHPVLGSVLFFLLIALLLVYGSKKSLQERESPLPTLPSSGRWSTRGTLLMSVVVTALLLPLYTWSPGSPLFPLSLEQDLALSMPYIQQYQTQTTNRQHVLRIDSPLHKTLSASYTTRDHHTFHVVINNMANPPHRAAYPTIFDSSELDAPIVRQDFRIAPGIPATQYWIRRHSKQNQVLYVDTEYTCYAVYQYKRVYLLVDIYDSYAVRWRGNQVPSVTPGFIAYERFVRHFTRQLLTPRVAL